MVPGDVLKGPDFSFILLTVVDLEHLVLGSEFYLLSLAASACWPAGARLHALNEPPILKDLVGVLGIYIPQKQTLQAIFMLRNRVVNEPSL